MISIALTFRAATSDDAAVLGAFADRLFRVTFGPDNSAADMDAHCAATFGVDRQRRELADPARHTLLAHVDGELGGFAQLVAGPAPDFVTGPAPLEILRFYVDPRWHGRGVAQALMDRTIAAAAARGAQTIYLAVWERNARAIAFYAKQGFVRVGARPFILGSDRQTDEVMEKRSLADAR